MGFITNQKTIFKIQKYIPVGYVVVDVQRLHEEKNSSDEKKINFAVFLWFPISSISGASSGFANNTRDARYRQKNRDCVSPISIEFPPANQRAFLRMSPYSGTNQSDVN